MIKQIKVLPNTFTEEVMWRTIYQGFGRLNLLIGGNGVGKTTLIQAIFKQVEVSIESEGEIRPYLYQNSKHNHQHQEANPLIKGEMFTQIAYQKVMAQGMSEGQSIIYSLLSFLDFLKEESMKYPNETIVALFDEVDSGLTPEHLNMVLHLFIELLEENPNIQIITSCNQYHWMYCLKKGLNLQTGDWVKIESYEEFMTLYINQMTELGMRREHKFLKSSKFIR